MVGWRKVIVCCLLIAMLLPLGCFGASSAKAAESSPNLSNASAVYFYHLESQRCMQAKNEAQKLPAGTSVRLLSGLIFCEQLGDRLGDVIAIYEEMLQSSKNSYRYGIEAGDVYTVEQLLYLAICGGYNDAFYVLAYRLGNGDVRAFVDLMNARAAELGAYDTTAADPSGISDSSFTTAMDLFNIARAAIENPVYMKISGSAFYDYFPNGRRIENRNSLICAAQDEGRYYNSLCKGLTAGKTDVSGWSVITLSQKGNDRYLSVVLGGKEGAGDSPEKYGYALTNQLIKWGYDNYRYLEVLNEETLICTMPVEVSDLTASVTVKPMEAFSLYLPADATVGEEIRLNVRLLYDSLEAPVAIGTHVGYVAIIYEGEIMGTVPIYTAEEAVRSEFAGGLMRIKEITESRVARAGLIFFAVMLTAWILTEYIIKRVRRHRWDRYFSEKIDTAETFLNKF